MSERSTSLRIGILSARFPPAYYGGAELQAAELARRLARRHRVVVFTRDGADPRVLAEGRAAGLEIVARNVGDGPLRPLEDLVRSRLALRARAGALDVIVSYQVYLDGVIGVVARRALGVPVVVWVRGENEVRPEQSLKTRLVSRRVLAGADAVFVQSERLRGMTEALLARAPRRAPPVTVLPNGLELTADAEEPRAGLLFVGRLVRRKGVEHLLDALRRVPGVRLDVVGAGPDAGRLAEMARGLPVVFHGRRPPADVAGHMRRAAALVLPAVGGEGTPNVVLEAMAHGLPVIATHGGGVADLMRDGESGLLVPPADPAALAAALERLLGDAGLRRAMGERSRRAVTAYGWERVVPRVEDALATVVARARGGQA